MSIGPGTIVTLEIEKPAAGGRMLARHQGQVILVAGAIPGERVRARIERAGKGVAFAETVDVVTASPDRRASVDPRCGGNVLAHVAYPRQLRLKGDIIHDAFARIGRVPLPAPPEVIGSPEEGYRMRARLHAQDGRLGFYREGTHQLCDPGVTRQLLPSTIDWIRQAESAIERDRMMGLAGVEIAEDVLGAQRACHLELHAGADASEFAALGEGLRGLSAQASDQPDVSVLAGHPVLSDSIQVRDDDPSSAVHLRRDVRAFFQGNRFLLERMVRHVVSLVPAGPAVDLYAGVGLFGLALAAGGAESIVLVEGDQVSGADLLANTEPYFDRAQVIRMSVEAFLASSAGPRRHRPVMDNNGVTYIADPPRTGFSKEALASLIRLEPARIVYVSCDVATLARDTRTLLDAGYELGAVSGIDLFPNTAHVETIALFTR
jgi:23S rRNA (uracil1939-C5)-methyltransferase